MIKTPPHETAATLAEAMAAPHPTPLIECGELARRAGVSRVFVKVEGDRPLGSFKSLGGMLAGKRALARAAEQRLAGADDTHENGTESPPRLICASDGNHGLAVAAAAQLAGTGATIYLPTAVSRARAERIEALGGEIMWIEGTYDDAVERAAGAAARGHGLLISDTSPDSDDLVVRDVMAGYGLLAAELVEQFRFDVADRPSHIFVQAGVGGLAAAMAEGLQAILQGPAAITVVEPENAACVGAALAAGHPVQIAGDLDTSADMLRCGLVSAPALDVLLRYRAQWVAIDEDLIGEAVTALSAAGGPQTTPSGATGLAGLLHVASFPALRARHQLGADSIVLIIATEGAVFDPP